MQLHSTKFGVGHKCIAEGRRLWVELTTAEKRPQTDQLALLSHLITIDAGVMFDIADL